MTQEARLCMTAPSRDDLEAFATELGLSRCSDSPMTWNTAVLGWTGPAGELSYVGVKRTGMGVFVIGGTTMELLDAIAARFTVESSRQVIERMRRADDLGDAVRAATGLWTLAVIRHADLDRVLAAVRDTVTDDREVVRWLAGQALLAWPSEEGVLAARRATERFEEMDAFVKLQRRALDAPPTIDELRDEATEAESREDWGAAATALTGLMRQQHLSTAEMKRLSIALQHNGNAAVALGLLSVVEDRNRADDSTTARREALVDLLGRDGSVDLELVRAFFDHHDIWGYSFVKGIWPHVTQHRASLALLTTNQTFLADVVAEGTDSPDVLFRHVRAQESAGNYDGHIPPLQRALDALDSGSLSEDAIAARELADPPVSADEVLHQLCREYSFEERWDDALPLAARLREQYPDCPTGWVYNVWHPQDMGDPQTAAVNAAEALRQLDRIVADPDLSARWPTAQEEYALFRYDLARAFVEVGRTVDGYAELQFAVREDRDFAAKAAEDPSFASVVDDPGFAALIACDPVALARPEELTVESQESRLRHVMGELLRGEDEEWVAEQYLETLAIAEACEHLGVQAHAHCLLCRLFTYHDPDLELALQHGTAAVALSTSGEVTWERRVEALLELGNARLESGEPEAAEKCQLEARSIQEQHLPAAHPDIARTMGSLSRSAEARGEVEKSRALRDAAIAVFDAYVAEGSEERDGETMWGDALLNRSIVSSNRAAELVNVLFEDPSPQPVAAAVAGLDHLIGALDALYADRFQAEELVDKAYQIADIIGELTDEDPEWFYMRLARLGEEPDEETQFWRGFRSIADSLSASGRTAAEVADILAASIRGEVPTDIAEELPVLRALAGELAPRMSASPMLIATMALGFEAAKQSGDLDKALDDMVFIGTEGRVRL